MVIVGDEIISGFIGEVVSRCLDFSWAKIKESVKNRKNKHQNIESQIYNVVVNVLNQITYNKFKDDQDKIYQAAEKLLIGYKDSRCDSIEVVKSGLQILGENINNDKYIKFKKLLYQELGKDDYEELYRQIRLLQQDEESSKVTRIEKKIDKVQQSVDEAKRKLDAFQENNRGEGNIQNKESVKSRTQEYADKWYDNMFLNDFDKRDKNAGINIKLRELYLEEHLPHYIWYKNDENEISTDLKELLSEYINEKDDNKMLLILGQPGIGKSTLITWITANFRERINDILVYRFASDLGNVDWENEKISIRVLEELGLQFSDLKGKTLIIDGFDEVSIESTRRRYILDKLYSDWIYDTTIGNFSLIITCRENYVPQFAVLKCKYIILKPWDEIQIRSFCNLFQKKTKNIVSMNMIEKLLENKEVLGIPLLLYMVLALNISIEKEGSIVDAYDKIFSLEGGIYDRCIDNREYAEPHRISEIKKQIHQISREISMWMFENEPDEAYIPHIEYEKICDSIIEDRKEAFCKQDFVIGNYFKLIKHCEGIETGKLCFIHRTIYEYFVAETIYNSIEEALTLLSENDKKKLAKKIVDYIKIGKITNTIGEYFQRKVLKKYNRLDSEKKVLFYDWLEDVVCRMMNYGMFYYTGHKIQNYKNIIIKEAQCFENLVKVLRLVQYANRNEYILKEAGKEQLERYLWLMVSWKKQQSRLEDINLSNMFLKDVNLRGLEYKFEYLQASNLSKANLSKAVLIEINLQETKLEGANLSEADLRRADLRKVNLQRTDLHDADLRSADLRGADLYGANLLGTQLDNSIWLTEDVLRFALDLKKAQFVQIVVEGCDNEKKIIYKNQIC